jgi:hypothetical protein
MNTKQALKIYMKEIVFWFVVCLVFSLVLIFCLWPEATKAEGGSLSIFPQTGSFTTGNTFEVSIFMNTGGNNINAVKVDLKFDPQ